MKTINERDVNNMDSAELRNLGFGYLLGIDTDPKTAKSNKRGKYLTAIMYLSPSRAMCPGASKGCLKSCLNTAGNPVYLPIKRLARRARTNLWQRRPVVFVARLVLELERFVTRCEREGVKPAVRLNGTSDIAWERVASWLFKRFHIVQFYDYTKLADRMIGNDLPRNYHLTYSRNEDNHAIALAVLAAGHNVAVVVSKEVYKEMPAMWLGYKTDDADVDDLTFARKGQVQLLKAKGKARKDTTGFVLHHIGVY